MLIYKYKLRFFAKFCLCPILILACAHNVFQLIIINLQYIVGWVKRLQPLLLLGSPDSIKNQRIEITSKLANPTKLVADRRLNPTYNLSFRVAKWIPPLTNLRCEPHVSFSYYNKAGFTDSISENPHNPSF